MNAVFNLILTVINMYELVVVVWIVLSWLIYFQIINPHQKLVAIVFDVTSRLVEPALGPLRRMLAGVTRSIGLDLSPIALFLILYFIQDLIVELSVRGGL